MVLYFNHCSPTNNMYPSAANRHPNQNFLSSPYMTYGAAQQSGGQYGVSPGGVPDMGPCAGLAAQYQQQMSGLGSGPMSEVSLHHPQSGGGVSSATGIGGMPGWHTPSYMPPCGRPVAFDDWGAAHQSALSVAASGGNNPCAQHVGLSSSPHGHMQSAAGSCNFGGHLYKVGGGGPSSTGAGTPNSVAGGETDYAGHVQVVQDLTNAGHHSPDSGLTVSSDGVSSSDSPQHAGGGGGGGGSHHNHPAHLPPASSHPHHLHHPAHLQHPHHVQALNRPTSLNRPTGARSPFGWMHAPKTSYQSQPNPGKTRTKDKYRVVYSDHQRLELEKEFHYSRYITIRRKAELAQMLGLSERQVKIWFQNRRAKERKQGKKRDEIKTKDMGVAGSMGLSSQMQGPPGGMLPTKIINLD